MKWRHAARGVVMVAWCTLPGVAWAAEPDSSEARHEQRIRELEEKVASATEVLGSLRLELDALKREAGMAPSPADDAGRARGGPEVLRASYVGDAGGVPLYRVAAGPVGADGKAESPTTPQGGAPSKAPDSTLEDQAPPAEQESPGFTPAFLRDARALLLPRNRLELEPGVQLTSFSFNQLNIRGLDIINSIFIGTIDISKLKQRTITPYVQLRYGITDNVQFGLRVPYVIGEQTTSIPASLTKVPAGENLHLSSSSLGDVEADLAWNVLHEGRWFPDLVLNGVFKARTGNGPYTVSGGGFVTGSGFYAARLGATVVKVTDPATLFASAGYFYHIASSVRGIDVDPPDSIDIGAGIGYALNPVLSLTSRVESRWVTATKVGGKTVEGSDTTLATFSTGIAYGYSSWGSYEFSLGIGLTPASQDFSLQLSMPFNVDLPKWWWWD